MLCKHGALQRQSLEPSRTKRMKHAHEARIAEDFAEAKQSVKQSPRALARAPRIVEYLNIYIYIYIYMCVCMCREVVRGRTGRVLMD